MSAPSPFSRVTWKAFRARSRRCNIISTGQRTSEIVRDHGVVMLLGTMRAEERLAFLLNLSQRFTARGYSLPSSTCA